MIAGGDRGDRRGPDGPSGRSRGSRPPSWPGGRTAATVLPDRGPGGPGGPGRWLRTRGWSAGIWIRRPRPIRRRRRRSAGPNPLADGRRRIESQEQAEKAARHAAKRSRRKARPAAHRSAKEAVQGHEPAVRTAAGAADPVSAVRWRVLPDSVVRRRRAARARDRDSPRSVLATTNGAVNPPAGEKVASIGRTDVQPSGPSHARELAAVARTELRRHQPRNELADDVERDRRTSLWKLEMPGMGGSTPAVWEKHIFLTSQDGDNLVVVCCEHGRQAALETATRHQPADSRRRRERCFPLAQHRWQTRLRLCRLGAARPASISTATKSGNSTPQDRYGRFQTQHGMHTTPLSIRTGCTCS